MQMGIDETRYDRPAPGIDDIGLGTGQFPDLGVCADCNYAIAVDGDRFRAAVVLVHREHDAIRDDARWRIDGKSRPTHKCSHQA
jgi:hypothetical protein